MFFFISLAVLYCMRKVGYAIGLTDKPTQKAPRRQVVPFSRGHLFVHYLCCITSCM
ncbi:hypothetical protein OK016_10505 [Vibrio chagasii]|nr:hypothetical protein [Vibrio chagasii]